MEAVDTLGQRVRVEWDPTALVTPMGQLVYFSKLLATVGFFSECVKNCPLSYTSPNAPAKQDVLGTLALAILGVYSWAGRPAEHPHLWVKITRRGTIVRE